MNIKTDKIYQNANFSNYYIKDIKLLDNNIYISSRDKENSRIDIIDKNDMINNSITEEKIKTLYTKDDNYYDDIKIYPCVGNYLLKTRCDNHIIVIESLSGYRHKNTIGPKTNNIITVYNILNKNKTVIEQNILGSIRSVVYLNNGYFAILIDRNIVVYSIALNKRTQHFLCKNDCFLESLNSGRFVTVNENCGIKLYE